MERGIPSPMVIHFFIFLAASPPVKDASNQGKHQTKLKFSIKSLKLDRIFVEGVFFFKKKRENFRLQHSRYCKISSLYLYSIFNKLYWETQETTIRDVYFWICKDLSATKGESKRSAARFEDEMKAEDESLLSRRHGRKSSSKKSFF